MASPEHEFLLPRVEESDLLNHVFEDVTDPTHKQRWLDFAHSNGLLAQEVLKRIYIASGADPEMQKRFLDEITYVYTALATAALRLSIQEHPPIAVGDGAEYQPPST
jgi:hypothetical protein